MLQFLFKIFVTPENIVGIILKFIEVIGMCFIFRCLELKWWKSLIPFYDEFTLYQKVFKHKYITFISNTLFLLLQFKCVSLFRKYILGNIFTLIKTRDFSELEIDAIYLIVLVLIYCIAFLICFIFQRIANIKALQILRLPAVFQIFTFLIPDIFLFIDAIYYLHKKKKEQQA